MNKSLCFTGCRPHKIDMPYDISDKKYNLLIDEITKKIVYYIQQGVDTFYSGGADGIDILSFFIVHKLKKQYPNIKNIVCIPTSKQREWSKSGKWYDMMIKLADKVILVYEIEEYKSDNINVKLDNRNKYMVNNSDYVLAVWNGSSGGTYNCIKYAKKQNKKIGYIIIGDNMQIIKNDAQEFINNNKILNKLVNSLEQSENINKALEEIKSIMEKYNKYNIVMGTDPLDDVFKDYTIKNIDEKSVIFENDNYEVKINIK